VKISTNGQERHILYWEHLTTAEQQKLPVYQALYHHADDLYVRYRGKVYPLPEFRHIPDYIAGRSRHSVGSPWAEWDRYMELTPSSGLVLRTGKDVDHVVIGTYDTLSD
jgi:hypothetical protein